MLDRAPRRRRSQRAWNSRQRATLRKYGVRFGAYHIYFPALAQAGAARARGAIMGAAARTARRRTAQQRPRRSVASRRQRPHLDPGRSRDRSGALSHRRLSRVRRARRARRYPGAARRSDPAGAVHGAKALLDRSRRVPLPGGGFTVVNTHDVVDRRFGRRFRLDPALARLPHGAPAEAAGAAAALPATPVDGSRTAVAVRRNRCASGDCPNNPRDTMVEATDPVEAPATRGAGNGARAEGLAAADHEDHESVPASSRRHEEVALMTSSAPEAETAPDVSSSAEVATPVETRRNSG